MLFALFIALAVVLAISAAISAAIVATRRPAVTLLQFAPAFGGLGIALTLPGHRNVPGSAALLACCVALLIAAGVMHQRGKKAKAAA